MRSYYDYEYVLHCYIFEEDIAVAETAYAEYKNKEGYFYEKDPYKIPKLEHFCALFFSQDIDYSDVFEFTDFPYDIPYRFVCENTIVAEKLYRFLRPIEYHNQYLQTYRTVRLNEHIVIVENGDY